MSLRTAENWGFKIVKHYGCRRLSQVFTGDIKAKLGEQIQSCKVYNIGPLQICDGRIPPNM